jgi:hypothetical protein
MIFYSWNLGHQTREVIKNHIPRDKKMILCWEDGSGEIIKVDPFEYEIQGEFVKLMRDLD